MTQHQKSPTLSELITYLAESWHEETFDEFLALLLKSQLGVRVDGVPDGVSGPFVVGSTQSLSLGRTTFGDGRSRILVFADPEEFIARFGLQFNGEINGAMLVNVVLYNADCEGILVNSALSSISVPIERSDIQRRCLN